MRTNKLELSSRIVIKLGTLPLNSVVAHRAILGKSRGRVAGILGVVVVGQVTGNAHGGRALETVILMALAAGHADVRSAEREFGGSVMIELAALPLRGVMTHCAILGESRSQMVGVLGAVVVGQVTGNACRGRAPEAVVLMALTAGHADVCPTEQEPGGGVVIELGTLPLAGVMAHRAILWESRGGVVGILGVVVVGQVT